MSARAADGDLFLEGEMATMDRDERARSLWCDSLSSNGCRWWQRTRIALAVLSPDKTRLIQGARSRINRNHVCSRDHVSWFNPKKITVLCYDRDRKFTLLKNIATCKVKLIVILNFKLSNTGIFSASALYNLVKANSRGIILPECPVWSSKISKFSFSHKSLRNILPG